MTSVRIPPRSLSCKMKYHRPCAVSLLDERGGVVVKFTASDHVGERRIPPRAGRVYEGWFILPPHAVTICVDDDEAAATFTFLPAEVS